MWVLIYITRTVTHDKALSQRLHGNGFSSVWVIGSFQNIDSGVSQCVVPCVDTGSFLNNGQIVTKLSIMTHCRGTGCSVYIRVFTPACALWFIWCWRESFITTAALNWSLQCELSFALQEYMPARKPYHKGCIGMVSAQYVFYDVSLWLHWNGASPVWVLLCITRKSFITKDTLEWFLPSMSSLGDISEVVVV